MFYVIDRRKLQATFLIIVFLVVAIWLAVSILRSTDSPRSGAMVFWQQFTGRMQRGDGATPTTVAEDKEPKSLAVMSTSVEPKEVEGFVKVKPAESDGFAEFRIERDRTRSQQIAYLEEMIRASQSDAQQAESKKYLEDLLTLTSLETTLEGMIKARGYSEAIAVITDNSINILVKDTLTQQEAAQLGDMTARVTGMPPVKVKILDSVR